MAGCVAFAAWPVFVLAGNQVHPRTPVDWSEAPCVQVVERDLEPVLQLDYTVRADDDMPTLDELPDSRTHQFIALAEHHPPSEKLPRYLNEADLQRALDAELQLPEFLAADPVVDTHPYWQSRVVRITADDARVPITHAQAANGVQWDTSGLEEGAYFVQGYTWEPDTNLWSPREGVVLVVDNMDGAEAPPAAAMLGGEGATDALASAGEAFEVHACVRAAAGASATFEFREVADDELEAGPWTQFDMQTVSGGSLVAEFVASTDLWGKGVDLRVRVRDASGREVVAYAPRVVEVINEAPSGDGTEGETGGDLTPPGASPACSVDADSRGIPMWSLFLCSILAIRRRCAGGGSPGSNAPEQRV